MERTPSIAAIVPPGRLLESLKGLFSDEALRRALRRPGGGGLLLGMYLPGQPLLGAWFTAAILAVFAVAGRMTVAEELHAPGLGDATEA